LLTGKPDDSVNDIHFERRLFLIINSAERSYFWTQHSRSRIQRWRSTDPLIHLRTKFFRSDWDFPDFRSALRDRNQDFDVLYSEQSVATIVNLTLTFIILLSIRKIWINHKLFANDESKLFPKLYFLFITFFKISTLIITVMFFISHIAITCIYIS